MGDLETRTRRGMWSFERREVGIYADRLLYISGTNRSIDIPIDSTAEDEGTSRFCLCLVWLNLRQQEITTRFYLSVYSRRDGEQPTLTLRGTWKSFPVSYSTYSKCIPGTRYCLL